MRLFNWLFFAILGAALARLNDNDEGKRFYKRVSYWVALACALGIQITAALI